MKPKTVVLLAIAVGSGLLAMLGVQQAMSGSAAQEETVNVLVVIEEVSVGSALSEANVAFEARPVSGVPQDAITTPEQYAERSASYPLAIGDIVQMSKLTEKGQGGHSVLIPVGMRVIAIAVGDKDSMSGLINPGDHVDVLVT